MKIITSTLLLIMLSVSSYASNDIDSLLRVLDNTIIERPGYSHTKELRIDSLRKVINLQNDQDQRFLTYQRLFKEYRHYNMDSALSVGYQKLSIATSLHNQQYQYLSNMNIAEILGIMGMYKESIDMINVINKQELDKAQWAYYYHVYHSTYNLLYENSLSQKEKMYYAKLISQYKDSLLQVIDPTSISYKLVENGKLMELGKYDEALALMKTCYHEYGNDSAILGTLAYGLSDIYEKKGNFELQKKYLIISAITDLRKAVKGYISLRKLAILLYQQGDLDRAYAYITCSMEDATFCKARFRTLEVSQALPIINGAYNKKITEERQNLIKYLILISILSIILAINIVYIYLQLKKLSKARKVINGMYEDMKKMNTDLNELNTKLSESNFIKETYIGSIFNLCSTYIDKMEAYRITIHRKIKSGQLDEVIKTTTSTTFVADELKEFFRNFDAIFLNIYPNFVDDFNSLLIDGQQIIPKSGDILPPELRIFALVRLGISDSSQIASFFHYSPQTVYNYKLKIRNKLAVSREEFAIAIQEIGK